MSRPLWRRFGVAVLSASLTAALLVGTPTTAVAASSSSLSCTSMTLAQVQARILSDVNAARKAAKKKPLSRNSFLDTVATNWSKRQAKSAKMSHNPSYASQIPPGWSAAGENVAYGQTPTKVNAAWMNSSGHRANILRTGYTHIGIGAACSASGRLYYTQVFGQYTRKPGTAATPSSVKASAGKTSAKITWGAQTYSDSRKLTGFLVTVQPGGKTIEVWASKRTATVKGLVAGRAYTFKVKATNAYGSSYSSKSSSAVRPKR